MSKDDLGDRMKGYEDAAEMKIPDTCHLVVRIDGRSFSKFTRGFDSPFDADMTMTMREVTKALVKETKAEIGYTQSDEITLILRAIGEDQSRMFAGRTQKLASVLAGKASTEFVLTCPYIERVQAMRPHFDARVFGVPDATEATNALLWRAQDARKNAIQSIARAHFSHTQLQGKGQRAMLGMLEDIGVTTYDYPSENVYGSYFQRRTVTGPLPDDVWETIPDDKKPKDRVVTRTCVEQVPILYLGNVVNRTQVVFNAEEPVYAA